VKDTNKPKRNTSASRNLELYGNLNNHINKGEKNMNEEQRNEKVMDAIDRINTVQEILEYLSNTRTENGLCSIMDHCRSQLQDAKDDLLISREG
jgi:uncharacterized protein YeeX (DUF496 family)